MLFFCLQEPFRTDARFEKTLASGFAAIGDFI